MIKERNLVIRRDMSLDLGELCRLYMSDDGNWLARKLTIVDVSKKVSRKNCPGLTGKCRRFVQKIVNTHVAVEICVFYHTLMIITVGRVEDWATIEAAFRVEARPNAQKTTRRNLTPKRAGLLAIG